MAKPLDIIIEEDVADGDFPSNDETGSIKSKLNGFYDASSYEVLNIIQRNSLGKEIEFFSTNAEPLGKLEPYEPECELDPSCVDDALLSDMRVAICKNVSLHIAQSVPSKDSHKKRRESLIDRALKGQQKQQYHDVLLPPPQTNKPVYIGVSDLAADWSAFSEPLPEPTSPCTFMTHRTAHEAVDGREAVMSTKTKRNRKKSLIDKAAMLASPSMNDDAMHKALDVHGDTVSTKSQRSKKKSLIDKAASRSQITGMQTQSADLLQMKAAEPLKQVTTYPEATLTQAATFCSLCASRKKNTFCGLCGNRGGSA